MGKLANKVALVTGASKGIGAAGRRRRYHGNSGFDRPAGVGRHPNPRRLSLHTPHGPNSSTPSVGAERITTMLTFLIPTLALLLALLGNVGLTEPPRRSDNGTRASAM